MGTIISVYTQKYFHEYVLPPINNADYSLNIHRNQFGIREDISIRFEIVDGEWKILPQNKYAVYAPYALKTPYALKAGDNVRLVTVHKEQIALFVDEVTEPFSCYKKYDVSHLSMITIGKDDRSMIRYDYHGMISGDHATIRRQGNRWFIQNSGKNGTYLNSVFLTGAAELNFGDFINILGLHIVFLSNCLAVNVSEEKNIHVNENALKEADFSWKDKAEEQAKEEQAELSAPVGATKILFHRSPRNMDSLETEQVEIEAPPPPVKSRQQPLLLTIGPSFTMAIPMLLGCLLMIYASNASGANMGLYMYSGLVMAVSSAVIGVIWALVNMRYQKKIEQEDETHRFDAYSRYLTEKTDEIRVKYDHNTKVLREMYPEAAVCVNYSERTPELWNRNFTHDDFLKCRLGVGDIPFQANIQVPKKKFTLNKDSLEEKPELIRQNFKTLFKVPILLDILHHPMTGIVGGTDKKGAIDIARTLSLQIAANHCYTDVKLAYIFDSFNSADDGEWDFARWLPHVWAEDKKLRFVASNKSEISDVCYELTKVFRQRKEERGQGGKKEGIQKPHFVLFLSDASLIEEELLSKYVFDKDESLGFSVLILSDTYENLPNACDYIIQNDANYKGLYSVSTQKNDRTEIAFDRLNPSSLDDFARHISNLEVQEIETGGEIPNTLTFFEMYGVSRPDELQAEERWLKNRTYDNIRGLIGEKAGGAPCYMDVHEKYHGPHGLVAGTTGSGKSETLQTYILSLALNYSPDDVGFFLIDYKGGGMAHLFDGMPHVIGQISNLSGNQIHRAMVSIKSENHRRQRIFNENGVNNINAYTKLVKNKEAKEPVPHLFIIIDEFAELKREEPGFMRELISVAQVGRSLGVHLILATQKPSGTVDDNIWSNSKFRLCLRVQDRQDSMDMLRKPDAAYITQAGRCYLQVGSDEVYELFQSGWSGAPYDENIEQGSTDLASLLAVTGRVDVTGGHAKTVRKNQSLKNWVDQLLVCVDQACSQCGLELQQAVTSPVSLQVLLDETFAIAEEKGLDFPQNRYNQERLDELIHLYLQSEKPAEEAADVIIQMASLSGAKLPLPKEQTQLDAVIHYLAVKAAEGGYQKAHQLWMPVLPDRMYLDSFEEFTSTAYQNGQWKKQEGPWNLDVVIGRLDDPANQAQLPLHISFSQEGHLAVIGSVVSGKSTFVQTLLYALTKKYSPDYINIYGIDFSSKMMSGFEKSPHVGGVAYEGEYERIGKLFHMIEEILAERKKLFRGGNYSQYVQVHGVVLPAIFLVIDNFAAFKEKTEDKYEGQIITLSKEGVSHGIYLIITAGGFSTNELPSRIAENMRINICLEMPDKYAYSDILHTIKIDVLPETGIKGRGLAIYEGQILEYQTALAREADDDYTRMERISEEEAEMAKSWKGMPARRIPEIPEKPVWTDFAVLPEVVKAAEDPYRLPVGYDEESAEVYSIDLSKNYCYLITGNVRTGKRNFMKVMIQSCRLKKADIYVVDGANDMNVFTGFEDVNIIQDVEGIWTFLNETLAPVFIERNRTKKELELQGAEEEELFAAAAKEKPIFIFIADLPWFLQTVYEDERDMNAYMENLIQKGRWHNIYFVGICGLESRGDVLAYQMFNDFASYHTGIHFGGNAGQNTFMNFEYLGYAKQTQALKPGIGLLPEVMGEHETERLIVPLAKWRRPEET